MKEAIEERIERLQAGGIIDMHFDLPMDLYEKRERKDVLETEFLPEFEAGNISVVGVAIYIEDRYLPENGLRVALDQIARLYAETAASQRFAICKSYREIQEARETGKIALSHHDGGSRAVGDRFKSIARVLRTGCALNRTYPRANQCGGARRSFRSERLADERVSPRLVAR